MKTKQDKNMLQAPKGTKDILPKEIETWYLIEDSARELFQNANFKEIRTPIFEATGLFSRGVGESTDIVNKEMYTFEINSRSLTLRPENTAGVVRAYIENGFSRVMPPVKLWYKGPMFRYERPQAGRQRQFHQIGIEIFGEAQASADAESIYLAMKYFEKLGLNQLEVELNSLGCKDCRITYKENLKKIFEKYIDEFCPDCQNRYEKNPLRILDCKIAGCKKIIDNPEITSIIDVDYICADCANHFDEVQNFLKELKIPYKINKQLVRGLDYYNRTVFEIKSYDLGAQNAVCGGGRYDGLVEMLGGTPTPAVGWAVGMERLASLIAPVPEKKLDYYVISHSVQEAVKLALELRSRGLRVDFDYRGRKFSKQLERAVKTADYALILGEEELAQNKITVKNLSTTAQKTICANEFLDSVAKSFPKMSP